MRKNLFLAIATIFISLVGSAQINKGSVLLGGGINFNNTKQTAGNPSPEQKDNSIGFTPVIGVAIRQNLVAGIQLTYIHIKDNLTSSPEYENNFYGTELFIREYLPLGKGFYLFGQAGLYYRNSDNTYNFVSSKQEQKDQYVGIELYPGISYAVTKRFHLEVGLANLVTVEHSRHRFINNGAITDDRKGISVNASTSSLSNLNIGFRFFFAKK